MYFIMILVLVHLYLVDTCPPQPAGNCYAGAFQLPQILGGIKNQACGNVVNRDWCAVSYMPATQQANFGCASNFQTPLVGGPICGDGPGFVNQQGCSMVNTDNGPCYFCCCKGGSCNHPEVFAREAAKLPINAPIIGGASAPGYNPQYQQPSYPIPWYNSSNSLNCSPLLTLIILLFLFIF